VDLVALELRHQFLAHRLRTRVAALVTVRVEQIHLEQVELR
jgi:hypothetical protein